MNVTAETRAKWREKVEGDPYGMYRASAIKVLLDDIDELLAALKPFAEIGGRFPTNDADEREMYHTNLGRLTLKEFRDAWAAMDDADQQNVDGTK